MVCLLLFCIFFHETGLLLADAFFEDDELAGISKEYYPSGNIKTVIEHNEEKTQSVITEYYPSGVVRSESVYNLGKISFSKKYDQEGRLLPEGAVE